MSNNYIQSFYKDLQDTLREISADVVDFFKNNKKGALIVIGVYLFWKWFIKNEDQVE